MNDHKKIPFVVVFKPTPINQLQSNHLTIEHSNYLVFSAHTISLTLITILVKQPIKFTYVLVREPNKQTNKKQHIEMG